jgi:DNA-binding Xre family transcriptional regulator/predicted transcriptional regulator
MPRSDQFSRILLSLKQILKTRKISYRELANQLKVSEPTIKRLFYSEDCPIGRLIEICELLNIPFSDLVQQSQTNAPQEFTLSEKQEAFFSRHTDVYAFFRYLQNGVGVDEIRSKFHLSQKSIQDFFLKLEKWELITLRPKGQFILKKRGAHRWILHGPLEMKFNEETSRILIEVARKHSDKAGYYSEFSSKRIHKNSLKELAEDLKKIHEKFMTLALRDQTFHPSKDLSSASLVSAIAPVGDWFDRFLHSSKGPE